MLLLGWFLAASVAFAQEGSVYNAPGNKVAWVIGIGAYEKTTPLVNPENDASAMADALRALDFNVIETLHPTSEALRRDEAQFVNLLFDADVAMLYYAGHSIQVNSENYILPTDSDFGTLEKFRAQTMGVSSILTKMDRLAKMKIVVLDACRDNPFAEQLADATGDPQLTRGLAPITSLVTDGELSAANTDVYGTIVAYAAAPGRTALDGEGQNSPYTKALLSRLHEPGLEVGRLFRQVAADVIEESQGKQRPEYLVKLTDEFYFRNIEPHQCDYLAAEPINNLSIPGVEFDLLQTDAAIAACTDALSEAPDHARYSHNLARALDAAGRHKDSIPHYRVAAKQGYVHALNNLGVMHINGQGVGQDFVEGTRLLNEARTRGHVQARVNLQGTDFGVLMSGGEFRKVQQELASRGHYSGPIDGDFGKGSKAALTAYQKANRFAENGLTLETLDALGLLGIIPNFVLE
ncbi:caspase family protein [Primorskyibacter aestuariivivens]|uniref:caspase family protein n=1 Tax=Primorskyibacter aestuariivivens TaxID=1888912 RepID=UPI00230052D9|nr:caspase family protein [Primorskyibacter aestuariivivens]MDA7430496.1 caspase family protein [Primorskyibacter aestuariivivens]